MGFAFWFLLVFALASPLPAQSNDGLGTWVWSQSAWATEEARQELVQFSLRHGIGHLDVHSKIEWQGETPVLETPSALRELILLAGKNRITTAILRGDGRMFFLENHQRARKELWSLIAFSKTLPANSLFKGIKYDVEPYCTGEWKSGGKARETVIGDYLTFLRQARSLLTEEAPGLWLAADTPYWWDRDEFTLEFEGETKRLSEHVQDLTEFIVIMSYWRSPEKVLESVERERTYAERIRKLVHPSVETIRLEKEPQATFWGVPAREFWDAVKGLQERAAKDPALGGVRIHNYRGLREKFGYRPVESRGAAKAVPLSVGDPDLKNVPP